MIILSTLVSAEGFAAVGLGWRSRFPDGNDRQKSKGKNGLAFAVSHPSQMREGWGTQKLNRLGDLFAAEVGRFQVFVAFLDGGNSLWLEFFKEGQEMLWIERFYVVIGILAGGVPGAADQDYGDFGLQSFECRDQFFGRHVFHARVHDDSVQGGIFPQSFDGFFAAVGSDDIEFRGFYDEFPRGDAT